MIVSSNFVESLNVLTYELKTIALSDSIKRAISDKEKSRTPNSSIIIPPGLSIAVITEKYSASEVRVINPVY
ncbi:hypothetical protein D3C86_1923760 [compost metagenome]